MVRAFAAVARLASSTSNLLLRGETGTGKRTFARLLHRGARASEPLVEFSCAALGEPLLESELFGHELGAFPWAISRRRGRLERAHGGTLFIDHVERLPSRLQMRLLEVLVEGVVEHVGGSSPIPVSVRLVAAASADLTELAERGNFLPDLLERISPVTLFLPPLRDRPEDVVPLASHFGAVASRRQGRALSGLSRDAARKLETHDWPGNLIELRSTMEHAVLHTDGAVVQAEALPDTVRWPGGVGGAATREDLQLQASLQEVEAAHIRRVLRATGGNLSQAADVLGIHRNTLRRKLREYGIPV